MLRSPAAGTTGRGRLDDDRDLSIECRVAD
jgi:hypothetical protein